MQLFAVSIREIEDDLINYFATTFSDDASTIFPGTNVKKRYRFTGESWGDLADAVSKLPWMVQIGVVLIQDDMRAVSTIAQLANLISKHVHQVVAPKGPINVTRLSAFMRSSNAAAGPASPAIKKREEKTLVQENNQEMIAELALIRGSNVFLPQSIYSFAVHRTCVTVRGLCRQR